MIAIFGFINIPKIKYSVEWWNTLHQPASIKIDGTSFNILKNEWLISKDTSVNYITQFKKDQFSLSLTQGMISVSMPSFDKSSNSFADAFPQIPFLLSFLS